MMKSYEIKLTNSLSCAVEAIQEVERACREAGLEGEQVNLKGTTEEGLGFTGRGEGISATAGCTILEKAYQKKLVIYWMKQIHHK